MISRPPRVGFLMEQALGHVAYTKNLQAGLTGSNRLAPAWMPVSYDAPDVTGRLPLVGTNPAMRASLNARAALRAGGGPRRFDALVYHTQSVALFSALAGRHTPVILSLDATPIGFDALAAAYQHAVVAPGHPAERLKQALYRWTFRSAAALTTWSQWAKDSLRDDYGVPEDRVTVIPPGVNLGLFPFGTAPRPKRAGPVRVLFVGGDFARKGGPLLIEAMRAGPAGRYELDIVSGDPAVPELPGVRMHRGLGPNDPRLVALYREADLFALPTLGDCLAVVLAEAMAAGLPIITTTVAAQPEAVQDGRSGIVIPPADPAALARALTRLAGDPALRRTMGREGRAIAEARFDTHKNVARLAGVIEQGIERFHRPVGAPARRTA